MKSTELTIGDAYNFGIICSIDQELGLSVRQFIQLDVSCVFIYYQPVVIITNLGIPVNINMQVCVRKAKQSMQKGGVSPGCGHASACNLPDVGGCLERVTVDRGIVGDDFVEGDGIAVLRESHHFDTWMEMRALLLIDHVDFNGVGFGGYRSC